MEIKILRLKSLLTPKEKFKSAYVEVQLGSGPPLQVVQNFVRVCVCVCVCTEEGAENLTCLQTAANADLDSITLQINFDEDFVLQATFPFEEGVLLSHHSPSPFSSSPTGGQSVG